MTRVETSGELVTEVWRRLPDEAPINHGEGCVSIGNQSIFGCGGCVATSERAGAHPYPYNQNSEVSWAFWTVMAEVEVKDWNQGVLIMVLSILPGLARCVLGRLCKTEWNCGLDEVLKPL